MLTKYASFMLLNITFKRIFYLIFFFHYNLSAQSFIDSLSKSIIYNEYFIDANIGIRVINLKDMDNVFSYQANKKFLPASNLKIVTAYLSLKFLPDSLEVFEYAICNDTLILYPSADPTLFYKNFPSEKVLTFLKNPKFKNIIINTSVWQEKHYGNGWSWDDYQENFMVEKTLMPIYGNRILFNYNPQKKELSTYPKIFEHYIFISNEKFLDTVKGKNFFLDRDFNQNTFHLKNGNEDFTPIEKPLITGNIDLIKYSLEQMLKVNVYISTNKDDIKKYSFYNTEKISALKTMLVESDNFIADQLLMMISKKKLGYIDVYKLFDSLKEEKSFEYPLLYKLHDGSGLSRYNLVSVNDLTLLLNKLYHEFSWDVIKEIFPTSNKGTLKNYFIDHNNYIYAKTGSMSNIFALSGFFIGKKTGNKYAFSFLSNGLTEKIPLIKKQVEGYFISMINEL